MDQWLKTGSLMSKLETSENTKDNEGNSEKPEIVHRREVTVMEPFLRFPTRPGGGKHDCNILSNK